MIVNRDTLAACFDLSPGRITQLCHEGVLSKVSRNRYDVAQCLQQFIDFKLQGGSSGSTDVIQARTALYNAQTHKCELEVERTRQETIPADEHVTDLLAFQRITDKALEGFDADLVNDLADLNDPAGINDRLTLATNGIRQDVADALVSYAATIES